MNAPFDLTPTANDVRTFAELYAGRPLKKNLGGMRFNHSFATWFILKTLQPATVVESGVWQGHSTWLIEQACPDARLFCLDVDFSHLLYQSPRATYIQKDFAQCSWKGVDTDNSLCFFDDHQNAYQRLKDMRWAGFKRAIFEDNHPCGEGDCYSLRHVLAGFGHPHIQMSPNFQGSPQQREQRETFESVIKVAGARQQLLVDPNTDDSDLFERNRKTYFEFPPVALTAMSPVWNKPYEGSYAGPLPLFEPSALPPEVARLMAWDESEFAYSFIAYVELN
jgi:hypothetical protein